jgi:hypothetical protein
MVKKKMAAIAMAAHVAGRTQPARSSFSEAGQAAEME